MDLCCLRHPADRDRRSPQRGRTSFHSLQNLGLLVACFFPWNVFGQDVSGKVFNERKDPLVGANVYWLGTSVGVSTDEEGGFVISGNDITEKLLVASYVGYRTDTLRVSSPFWVEFRLQEAHSLNEAIIQEHRDGVMISDLTPIKTEQITTTELAKAACCDLAGCFETQTTVQPQTTNVVTNSKELRILGLSGVYNQVLVDGFPLIQGLSFTYGISSIPGSLVENIYVAKGANSVLQGFESISGQINVETKEPDTAERLMLSAYINGFSEKHVNAHATFRLRNWSGLTAIHVVQPAAKVDRDHDTFLDLPLLTRYMISNKWSYGDDEVQGWFARIGLRFFNEQRIGGQTHFDVRSDQGLGTVYGQTVSVNQPEVWTKTGFRFNERQKVVLHASSFHQRQHSFFGTVGYNAQQTNIYGNLQYEWNYAGHELKSGISHRHLNLKEVVAFSDTLLPRNYAGSYLRLENITGLFAENTAYFFNNRLSWLVGLRVDHHSIWGLQFTPRTLVKYDVGPQTIVRVNLGTGWRTVNLFSENIGLLISSRNIEFAEALDPERARNWGVNLTHKFESNRDRIRGYFSADFYRTHFQNQVFPDYDLNPNTVVIQNFRGASSSNAFQAELFIKLFNQYELKTGYNLLDVSRKIGETRQLLPFNPKHRVLISSSYQPLSEKYHLDANLHWYGKQRLPNTNANPVEFQRPEFSQPYATLNVQFTLNTQPFEFYAGCENVFDFRQWQPIISWQNPSGPYFDTSSVWGPTRGRELYLGVRFKWKHRDGRISDGTQQREGHLAGI